MGLRVHCGGLLLGNVDGFLGHGPALLRTPTVDSKNVPRALQVSCSGLQEDGLRPLFIVDRVRKVLGFQTDGVMTRVGPVGRIWRGGGGTGVVVPCFWVSKAERRWMGIFMDGCL